jgi:hypothetical protein
MSWKDGLVDCKMPAEEYWFILWDVNYSRYHGIDRFDVDVSDEIILTNFKDMCFWCTTWTMTTPLQILAMSVE